jgi:MYXO-CTERM domain-containing protein
VGACDGVQAQACTYPADETPCGEARCDGAMRIGVGACGGDGACVDPLATLCDHGCEAGACAPTAPSDVAEGDDVASDTSSDASTTSGADTTDANAPEHVPEGCGCATTHTPQRAPRHVLWALAAVTAAALGLSRRRRALPRDLPRSRRAA